MRRALPSDDVLARILSSYGELGDAEIAPLGSGLINDTFLISASRGIFVLQRVNPIFDPRIHENIHAVTEHLVGAGLLTPTLERTLSGGLFVEEGQGEIFRLVTYVEGASLDVACSLEQVRSAGGLVARFHAVLDDLEHEFTGLRLGVHDTAQHVRTLEVALSEGKRHPFFSQVSSLARAVLDGARHLPPLPALPPRVCHGDLKLNNILFEDHEPPGRDRALCLIDLDTLGPQHLAYELGDAWRSWCNRAGEDHVEAELDLEILEASLDGYLSGLGRTLSREERLALLLGPEWVSLELTARFAADVLRESYFGWNKTLYSSAAEHNLLRARGQWSLHEAFLGSRRERAALLGMSTSPSPPGTLG